MESVTQAEREVVEDLFSALADGDADTALGAVHPEVVWAPVDAGRGGVLRGRDTLGSWLEERGWMPVEIDDVLRLNCWIVVLGSAHGRDEGNGATSQVAWTVHIADGLVIGAHGYRSWDRALETAGAVAGR